MAGERWAKTEEGGKSNVLIKNEGVTAEALESCGRGFHHQKIKMQRLQLEVSLQQREILTRFSVSLSFF